MEVSYSSFKVKAASDLLLLGRWEKWKSRCSCAISKRSGKVLPLDFSAERLFPRPFYPRIVLKTRKWNTSRVAKRYVEDPLHLGHDILPGPVDSGLESSRSNVK